MNIHQSSNYELLSAGIKKWIGQQYWDELRDIQEDAIPPILEHKRDVIISAATAAGKTEAAFLPACTYIAQERKKGFRILNLSPLKALINDQYRRLQELCEMSDLAITPWHGDVSESIKKITRKEPAGILLITPESLESRLLNHFSWCKNAFKNLDYVIIDEFHAFIGTERGCQLLSLLERIEFFLGKKIPRIALSATLNDLEQVAKYIRPRKQLACAIIESQKAHSAIRLQMKGYCQPNTNITDDTKIEEDSELDSFSEKDAVLDPWENAKGRMLMLKDIYNILRGKSHLLFANSRSNVEEMTDKLSNRCEKEGVPNEFFAHHGNLAKDIRGELETRLQKGVLPTTAVCTTTLELGIDIGAVDSIVQISHPHSVASMRQRLGRSGRHASPAVFRLFAIEAEIQADSDIADKLRIKTVQCIAMINLMLEKWCEPPPKNHYNLSTLVQQILSVIGQYGSVRADQLWQLLCNESVFSNVDQKIFGDLLSVLGKKNLITQTHDKTLIIGHKAERIMGHYSFFTAFKTDQEYFLISGGKVLGTLPIYNPLIVGQYIIFAGRRWTVIDVNDEKKNINLTPAKLGKAPLFGGSYTMLHGQIRKEMLSIYQQKTQPVYLDPTARGLLNEGIESFHRLGLRKTNILTRGGGVYLFPWCGDRGSETIRALFLSRGLTADSSHGILQIANTTQSEVYDVMHRIITKPKPSLAELATHLASTYSEKNDWALSEELRALAYGAKIFDLDEAWQTMKKLLG